MNLNTRWNAVSSLSLLDELLVDVAVRIQLSPTLHGVAVDHYEAIHNFIERVGSPLQGRVKMFYTQGSMAIGATIRSRDDDDLFDIDLVAELDLPDTTTPDAALDLLFDAINGEPGSKYHGKVLRQTRCVTVYYADMHLDVTPMFRNLHWQERGGFICHAHEEEGPAEHKFVEANPWGFAQWFQSQTPADTWFRQMFIEKAFAADSLVLERAEAHPVPDHQAVFAKPLAVIALQLMKRWVRINYEKRGATGRCLPSVVLSCSFATNSGANTSLADELVHQANALHDLLDNANRNSELIDVRNPRLWEDCLTDRWPGDLRVQRQFTDDLAVLIRELKVARITSEVNVLQKILVGLFGEKTTTTVIDEFYERGGAALDAGRSRVVAGSGVALAGMTKAPAEARTIASPKHRFFGD